MGMAESKVEQEIIPDEISEQIKVRRWRARLQLSSRDLERLYWSPYMMSAEDDRGILREDFFKWLKEPVTDLGNAMIDFVEPVNQGYIAFGELL